MTADVSAGWREEARAVHVDPDGWVEDVDAGPDAGIYDLPEPGELVRDRETDARAVVVAVRPAATAAGVAVDADRTVADCNPGYDPGAPVVGVAMLGDLDRSLPAWDRWPADRLAARCRARGVTVYDYPATRLEVSP